MGMAEEYDKLKKFADSAKKNKEHNDLVDANAAQKAARDAKREETLETTKQKRSSKSAKYAEKFKAVYGEYKKSSLKAYDNFVAAMMEIAGLMQAWSKSINADTYALLGGPLKDLITSKLRDLAVGVVASAFRVAEHRELAAVLTKKPIDMVTVTPDGALVFKSFEHDPDVQQDIAASGKKVPPNFFKEADEANRAAMMFLVRNDGFVYDNTQDVFVKNGQKLEQADLARLVASADFGALINDTMENHPGNSSPRP
tara:strand:+ start:46615 stop:47382 length:768 start_codon:yes stop_codon:yes gene_type:complete